MREHRTAHISIFIWPTSFYPFELCRWGKTPLDEGRMCGNKNLIKLLEGAKAAQLSEYPDFSKEITGITKF